MQLSFNPKKTKVSIEYSDFEENYSVELLKQIEHIVKKLHGCEVVSVEHVAIQRVKENGEELEPTDYTDTEQFTELLIRFLEERGFEETDDVIELSKEIDQALNISDRESKGVRWEPVKLVVNNLFMFPEGETVFDFDKKRGVTGIIGENYCGKSNVIRALIWVLYKKMLGGGDSDKLVNMYTESNKGYGKFYLRINTEEYCIERGVTVKTKKSGEPDVSYSINYTKKVGDKWLKEDSDENATQKKETDKVVDNAIGTFEDFTKVALLSQKGFGGYLTLSQQPKNDLVNKYLGLETFRDRYEYGNETFKKIKNAQKALGDPVKLEEDIKVQNKIIEDGNESLKVLNKEKSEVNEEIDKINTKILKETEKLIKIEDLEETDENVIKQKIINEDTSKEKDKITSKETEEWLNNNFKKEVPKIETDLTKDQIERSIETNNLKFKNDRQTYVNNELWVKDNPKKEEKDVTKEEEWVHDNPKKEVPKSKTNLPKKEIESEIIKENDKFKINKSKYIEIEEWLKDNPKKEEKDTSAVDQEIKRINEAISKLNDKLIVSKGGNEKCPTCGHILKEADPVLEAYCIEKIEAGNKALEAQNVLLLSAKKIISDNNEVDKKTNELNSLKNSLTEGKQRLKDLNEDLELEAKIIEITKHNEELSKKNELIKEAKSIITHNNEVDKKTNELNSLKNSLTETKQNIEKLKEDLVLSSKVEEILKHNELIEQKSKTLVLLNKTIDNRDKQILFLNEQIKLISKNSEAIEKNKLINKKIEEYKDDIKAVKVQILQLDEKIKEHVSANSIAKNNIENYTEKLNSIKESERIFKKYSIYLQAVHRDGIPAQIIRQKLPVINYKINNLLKDIVEFKIELYVEKSGDVKEVFYYGDNKKLSLPFNMSSGAQDFLGGVAIQNALHFVSKLSKPSLCMIDEGFGTLDEKHVSDINTMFNYFRKTYKNTLIITHKNEIKDFIDNIVYVSKTTDNLTKEQLKENPHAGVSVYDIK